MLKLERNTISILMDKEQTISRQNNEYHCAQSIIVSRKRVEVILASWNRTLSAISLFESGCKFEYRIKFVLFAYLPRNFLLRRTDFNNCYIHAFQTYSCNLVERTALWVLSIEFIKEMKKCHLPVVDLWKLAWNFLQDMMNASASNKKQKNKREGEDTCQKREWIS